MEALFSAENPAFLSENAAETERKRNHFLLTELLKRIPDGEGYGLTESEREDCCTLLLSENEESFYLEFYEKCVLGRMVTERFDRRLFFTYDERYRLVNYAKMFLNRKKAQGYMFGGTFNPMTAAHLGVMKKAAELPESFVAVVPTCDEYLAGYKRLDSSERISEGSRYAILTAATALLPNVIIDDIELATRTSYTSTYRTLYGLSEKYGQPFRYIIGSDDVKTLAVWFMPEKILGDYGLLVMKRTETEEELRKEISESPLLSGYPEQIRFLQTDPAFSEYSGTALRELLRNGDRNKVKKYMGEEAFSELEEQAKDSCDELLAAYRKGQDHE